MQLELARLGDCLAPELQRHYARVQGPVAFTVTRNEPGTYSVYVDGIPAGNFTVEAASSSDIILIASVSLLLMALFTGILMLKRRKRA